MKFDLVIQGPLDNTSISKVDEISSQFENVIISLWSEDDSSMLSGIESKNVFIFNQPTPDRETTTGVMKNSTFFYSISSTYLGLQNCTSNYTIKMRSDEYYEDFTPLKELFLENDDKFVFGNIFAKPWSHSMYHIGDHLFVAKTEFLLKAYTILHDLYTCKGSLFENSWAVHGFPKYQTAENILALSFLKAKEIDSNLWNDKNTFLEHYNTIDITSLGNYVACWKHGGAVYSSIKNPFVWNYKTMGDLYGG